MEPDKRIKDSQTFYNLLNELEKRMGLRRLRDCHGRMNWPTKGVYFFMEDGETRIDSGSGPRIVRVGTHAVGKPGAKSKLWGRLRGHRGSANKGGNHRGSIFRLLVGVSLINRDSHECHSWDDGKNTAPPQTRAAERFMEEEVSKRIGEMSLLCLSVGDDQQMERSTLVGARQRCYIESNSIALLSNYGRNTIIDKPSDNWLGKHCKRERNQKVKISSRKVRKSGLWNSDHVEDEYCPNFLEKLEYWINKLEER